MKTPRQPRGEARRRQVLEATLRLLAREGPRGVTHRGVAEEAGTSARATTYYFASREELLTEALRHYAETALARFERIATTDPAAREDPVGAAARMLADTVVSDLTEDRAGLVAEYELVLEAGRKPDELEAAYARWQAKLLDLLAAHARELGSTRPHEHARLVLATLRGLEIEALAHPTRHVDRDELCRIFRTLLRALIANA
ncbi:MAG: TetR/AcrR family transcriptional regulator [Myxococcota bacterium]